MASSIALAANNRNIRRFEHMQNKLLIAIDRRAKHADEDVLDKHLTSVTEDGERTWTFK